MSPSTVAPPGVLGLDPATYRRHPLHDDDRAWSETNCAVDMWIELLHSLGCEPRAAHACYLSSGLVADQWTFLKQPPEDLRALFGVHVAEVNLWRPLVEHAVELLATGRLMTVEVDAWWLPDTAGTSYREKHSKTSIMLERVDPVRREAHYFHGPGFFLLGAEDFDGALGWSRAGGQLPPYAEYVELSAPFRTDPRPVAWAQLADHWHRRPARNPLLDLGDRLRPDLAWLAEHGLEGFHDYAFGVIRQCGAGAGLLAAMLTWLDPSLAPAAAAFQTLAETAKGLQFTLARAARGRVVDVEPALAQLAASWQEGVDALGPRLRRD